MTDVWARSVARLADRADLSTFDGLSADAFAGKNGLQARTVASPLEKDQVRLAATELAGYHMTGPGAPKVFNKSFFDADTSALRRGVMYRRLVFAGTAMSRIRTWCLSWLLGAVRWASTVSAG